MKNVRTRDIVILIVGIGVLAVAAGGGYAALRARADGSGARQVLANVETPNPKASPDDAEPQYERWTVGKVVSPAIVRTAPDNSAAVKTRLGKTNANGYANLVLVDKTREVGGTVWYRVWLAMRPNESRGWVAEGKLAFYTTTTKITIDLSERELRVHRRGKLMGAYPVAVGKPGLETPTGFYFVNQKLKPSSPGGAYGVLAIGISAFQTKLAASDWIQGGPVAIHGTNEDDLIGKAVSSGCIRMHDKDVLEVSKLVPAGSPVEIRK